MGPALIANCLRNYICLVVARLAIIFAGFDTTISFPPGLNTSSFRTALLLRIRTPGVSSALKNAMGCTVLTELQRVGEPRYLARPKVARCEHATQVSCGQCHNACVTEEGRVYVWGSNRHGRLGITMQAALCETAQLMHCAFSD